MLELICTFLENHPGLKARTIATRLGLDRAEVSRDLHTHAERFEQDSNFQWTLVRDGCRVEFKGSGWLTSWDFEKSLRDASLSQSHRSVTLVLMEDGKPMLEFLARLLALSNQLAEAGKVVALDMQGSKASLTYLDRVGFFDLLHSKVAVLPERPSGSLAKRYQGKNGGVIEFQSIDPSTPDQKIPGLLQRSFVACAGEGYSKTAFTVLAELFGNVIEHSGTSSRGFAGLQFYKKTRKIQAVISDNGLGIVGTLEPVLAARYPLTAKKVAAAPHLGVALLEEVFSKGGFSQVNEDGRGLGLKVSAHAAGKFSAKISVRQSDFEFRILHDGRDVEFSHRLGLSHLAGTHVCFEFKLDSNGNSA